MLRCLALALAVLAVPSGVGAQMVEGAPLFQRCYACHSLNRTERNLPGPTLGGIFGRRAGALDDFDYSQALREAGRRGLVWSGATLDRFLEDPEEFIPGARMAGVRLRNPEERRALIHWLKDATK